MSSRKSAPHPAPRLDGLTAKNGFLTVMYFHKGGAGGKAGRQKSDKVVSPVDTKREIATAVARHDYQGEWVRVEGRELQNPPRHDAHRCASDSILATLIASASASVCLSHARLKSPTSKLIAF